MRNFENFWKLNKALENPWSCSRYPRAAPVFLDETTEAVPKRTTLLISIPYEDVLL
jgi:hypothetical protein